MYKTIVNLLFIFILSATVLPLKQVGNLLCKKQLTEELSEKEDGPKKADCKFGIKEYPLHEHHSIAVYSYEVPKENYACINSPLPVFPATDILNPPPNC